VACAAWCELIAVVWFAVAASFPHPHSCWGMMFGHDGVVSALHVFHGGSCVVPFGWVGACGAGVCMLNPRPWVQQ